MTADKAVSRGSATNKAVKPQIMILDDHPLVCKGLEDLLTMASEMEVFAVSNNASEALQKLEKSQPDLLLLDLSLPGTGGLDFLKDLRIRYPDIPVLVLSMHEENIYAERVLHAGARGYIMKQEPGEKVIEAIRTILSGGVYASQNLLSRILGQLASSGRSGAGRIGLEALGDRELQVYSLIGEGLSTKEIATKLHLSAKTVQTHREHIKEKLGLKNASELTHSAVMCNKSGC
jgi:DNA-binding NarL/FixJ family response regulator